MQGQEDRNLLILKSYYSCFRDSAAGQTILMDLEDKFSKRTFITDNINPYNICANEGARSVILYILSKIEEFEQENK